MKTTGYKIPRESLHMAAALLWAQRSECLRIAGQVGAVITTTDMRRILAIGYNGRARNTDLTCRNEAGNCGCLHAEMNAIAHVDSTIPDKTIFVTMQPCEICAQLIVQSNITQVYYLRDYRNPNGLQVLWQANVKVKQMIDDHLLRLLESMLRSMSKPMV